MKLVKEFPAKVTELDNVLAFAEDQLSALDASMKVTMQVTISLEEIFVNVANYAYPNSEGVAYITFDCVDGVAIIEIIDNGIQFNPLEHLDPDTTLSADERSIGGLGIFMTKKSMDEVTYRYENNQNILTMTKRIS